MSVVQFRTPGTIPLEAFTLMGINVKTSDHPIGRFGTGLKYAVAVILREGGIVRVFRGGVEHEFFLRKLTFRGEEFRQIGMRRRHGLGHWLRPVRLPFTTQLGRDWKLWQAYRELESNTRDEGGETVLTDSPLENGPGGGTVIEVDCRGFSRAIEEEGVFLDTDQIERVFRSPKVDIYDAPSRYLYCRGIRVYELRYPSLFTYDLGRDAVTLTEDRTIANVWSVMWDLARTIQHDVEDDRVLDRILEKSDTASFENYELNFSSDGSEIFRERVRYLGGLGRLGRSGSIYVSQLSRPPEPEPSTEIRMYNTEWEAVVRILRQQEDDLEAIELADKIEGKL